MMPAAGFKPALAIAIIALSSCKSAGPFPAFNLDGLSPAVRKALTGALETAQAQPKRSSASGQLGKLLLAHSLPAPALTAFERARRLDPTSPAWP
jgi:hypothetical protein